MRKKNTEVMKKWVTIQYNYIPKYCITCKLHGRNEKECYVIYYELFTQMEQTEEGEKVQVNKEDKGVKVNQQAKKGTK